MQASTGGTPPSGIYPQVAISLQESRPPLRRLDILFRTVLKFFNRMREFMVRPFWG
jgi:hypothetical protein